MDSLQHKILLIIEIAKGIIDRYDSPLNKMGRLFLVQRSLDRNTKRIIALQGEIIGAAASVLTIEEAKIRDQAYTLRKTTELRRIRDRILECKELVTKDTDEVLIVQQEKLMAGLQLY